MASARASPACGNCRSRRIKCNLLRPRCSQCARAGLDCTGYRSQSDLLFRDQTTSTIRRLHASSTRQTTVNKHTTCWSPVVTRTTFNVEELAQKVFSDNFAILGGECKKWMVSGAEHPSSVTVSLTSVGLAALAVVHKNPDMMDLARRKYNFAIRILTKATIGHHSGGIEQSVAGSFILSIFETLACLISGKTVPQFLLELPGRFGASSNTPEDDEDPLLSAMRLFTILGTLVNSRVLANQSFSPPDQLVVLAIKSDQTLQNWATSLPASWAYHELPKGPQYIYQDVWYARMWNYFRLARILANRIIIDSCDIMVPAMLPSDIFKLQHAQSYAAITLLSQEIYSSLPFMFKLEQVPATSLPLSAALFFTATLLQSLLGLTDRDTLIHDWSSPASEVLGESFTFTKGIVMQNLR
ncbi:hypothetical protein N7497_002215 [Penicillium chrysogenum]|uniref:Zn(2)-C6 fungal-type domain-containing protein n=1 Tax=Penicillium chrysogenum TaxID=5076 RepID=A0ABQ8WUD9_PENCH|nr:hypothetical protein N7505_000603 [Penicillium chrysogenum]KAJ6169372.1 hypothetical protein N7497_002215 [Penicillium chrysogenum]